MVGRLCIHHTKPPKYYGVTFDHIGTIFPAVVAHCTVARWCIYYSRQHDGHSLIGGFRWVKREIKPSLVFCFFWEGDIPQWLLGLPPDPSESSWPIGNDLMRHRINGVVWDMGDWAEEFTLLYTSLWCIYSSNSQWVFSLSLSWRVKKDVGSNTASQDILAFPPLVYFLSDPKKKIHSLHFQLFPSLITSSHLAKLHFSSTTSFLLWDKKTECCMFQSQKCPKCVTVQATVQRAGPQTGTPQIRLIKKARMLNMKRLLVTHRKHELRICQSIKY